MSVLDSGDCDEKLENTRKEGQTGWGPDTVAPLNCNSIGSRTDIKSK